MWFTYLILCKDKSIYTGITNDLDRRLLQHKEGRGGHYTRAHPPLKYLYSEKFKSRSAALIREAEIKKFSKEKKFALAH